MIHQRIEPFSREILEFRASGPRSRRLFSLCRNFKMTTADSWGEGNIIINDLPPIKTRQLRKPYKKIEIGSRRSNFGMTGKLRESLCLFLMYFCYCTLI